MSSESEDSSCTSDNRKRRMDLRRTSSRSDKRQRLVDSSDSEEDSKGTSPNSQKPSLRGIKQQARYVPGVPMTRDQLTQWRKEARRVRNRESAAASRAKTKERIDTLEQQVENLQSKYAAALQCILAMQPSNDKDQIVPSILRQDLQEKRIVSPSASPTASPQVLNSRNIIAPEDVLSLDHSHAAQLDLQPHHMISRPTAVSKNLQGAEVSDGSIASDSNDTMTLDLPTTTTTHPPPQHDDELSSFLWDTFSGPDEDLHLPLADDALIGV